MKNFPWNLLFHVAVLLGILAWILEGVTTFEVLVILLLIHIVELLRKKETINANITDSQWRRK